MEEIAMSLEAAGLPGGFHRAAAEVFRCLEGCRESGEASVLDEIVRRLLKDGDEVWR